MFSYWVEMAVSAGYRSKFCHLKKEFFQFSCMLVIDFIVSWLLKYVVLLLMVKIMLKDPVKTSGSGVRGVYHQDTALLQKKGLQ